MIRKAVPADIPKILQIYDRILAEEEAGRAVIGWVRGVYPTEATVRAGLSAQDLYVMEECGSIVAAARINQIQVPEYANAAWRCRNVPESSVLVLHTLTVDPLQNGKGYGSAFVRFYEALAGEMHCPHLRMDTNARNAAARRLYARLGYEEVDIVPCNFNGIPGVALVCLEKNLEAL